MNDHQTALAPDTAKLAVSPAFGEGGSLFSAEQLALVGTLAGEKSRIELTTFKQLYVEVREDRIDEVSAQLKQAGLGVHPTGFYTKSLITCNFCKGAEEAGLSVAEKLDAAIAGLPVPSPMKIGYAGCALGTSEPLLKDIGIVKMRDTFDIYVGGEPKTLKATLAELLVGGVPEERLIPIVTGLIDFYRDNAKKKETFARFVRRVTIDALKDAIDELGDNDGQGKLA